MNQWQPRFHLAPFWTQCRFSSENSQPTFSQARSGNVPGCIDKVILSRNCQQKAYKWIKEAGKCNRDGRLMTAIKSIACVLSGSICNAPGLDVIRDMRSGGSGYVRKNDSSSAFMIYDIQMTDDVKASSEDISTLDAETLLQSAIHYGDLAGCDQWRIRRNSTRFNEPRGPRAPWAPGPEQGDTKMHEARNLRK